MKKLENKVAVIYGNGSIGSAIAKAFALEGATVFLTGRTDEKLASIAKEIAAKNGSVHTAKLDALDEKAVTAHLEEVVAQAGKLDISFNTIGLPQTGIQGAPISELSADQFMYPMNIYLRSHFITAKAATRQMLKQQEGVIMMHTPNASRTSNPFVGGMPPTWAAMEVFFRSLSVECASAGIRTVCLQTTGIPETPLIDEVWSIHGKAHGLSFEDFHAVMEGGTHRKKLTTLREFTAAAVFAASDDGSAMTGTVLNLTAGMVI